MKIYVYASAAVLGLVAFYHLWKPLGGRINKARRQLLERSRQYSGGKFSNIIETAMQMSAREVISMAYDQLRGGNGRRPAGPLHPDAPDLAAFAWAKDTRLIWLGHSSFLLRLNGKTLLLDPMFSRRASPFQFAGPKRYASSLAFGPEELPPIDAVVISHDHYDHLDYGSIRKLRAKAKHFYVPLGVGAHLERWGVHPEAITELDWWEETNLGSIRLACTPSRHFSGRRFGDHCATLWASWVIASPKEKLFFSGDTGYGEHFAEIGRRYGPFDLTLMECGQYDKRWENIHMLPEYTVRAAKDLGSKLLIPIHWGAFTLAFHAWTDSVERAVAAAGKAGLKVATPRIGQMIHLRPLPPTGAWWKAVSD